MRIAIVSSEYPPDSAWDGAAIVYHNLAPALFRRGHEVHVICQAVGKPKDYVAEGVFAHRVGTNPKQRLIKKGFTYKHIGEGVGGSGPLYSEATGVKIAMITRLLNETLREESLRVYPPLLHLRH